ncbi:MAG: amidohydrolase [Lentisphaeria bacterium]|nr:amidohydrolase [Lentisphaeria bacterium]
MPILDAHIHLQHRFWAGHAPECRNADETVAALKRAGISGAVFTPWRGVLGESEADLDAANAEALEVWEAHRDFLYPGLSMHPAFPETSRRWLRRFRELGLVWAGEWVSNYCGRNDFDAPEFAPLFAACADNGMVVQLHNASGVPVIAARYPDLTVVASHLTDPMLEKEADLPNVYVDISGYSGGLGYRVLSRVRSLFGAERILFGTDFDGYDPEPYILRVERDFTPAEQEKVFSGNLLDILKRHAAGSVFPGVGDRLRKEHEIG